MANLKSIKKGDKVLLRMFTGAFVETKTVEMADASKIGFTNKSGIKMVFDKKTGKQTTPEPKAEKFANYVEPYDAAVEAEELEKKKKALDAKAAKTAEKAKAKEDAKAAAKAAKSAKATSKKASKKAPEPVEDEDDEYEEVDDDEATDDADDYEEVDDEEDEA